MRWAKRCAIGLATALAVVAALVYGPCQWYTAQRRIAAVEMLREVAKPYGSEVLAEETQQHPPDSANESNNGADTEALTLLRELKALYDERTSSDPDGSAAVFHFYVKGDTLSFEEFTRLEEFISHAQEIVVQARRFARMAESYAELPQSRANPKELSATYHSLETLLHADAAIDKRRGLASEAIADVLAAIRFLHASTESRNPVSFRGGLYRGASLGRIFELTDGLGFDRVPIEQILELESQLPDTYERDSFLTHLATAAKLRANYYDSIRNGTGAQEFLEEGRIIRDGEPRISDVNRIVGMLEDRFYVSPLGEPIRDMQEQSYANAMAHIIEVASLPYYQAVGDRESFDRSIGMVRGEFGTYRPSRVLADQANREAALDLLRVGLALERHRKQAGQYPASLDDVAPLQGSALPVDPLYGVRIHLSTQRRFISPLQRRLQWKRRRRRPRPHQRRHRLARRKRQTNSTLNLP